MLRLKLLLSLLTLLLTLLALLVEKASDLVISETLVLQRVDEALLLILSKSWKIENPCT